MKRPGLENRVAIDELYARYSWALDTGDTDGYVSLFLPDAEIVENLPDRVERRRGHAAIRDFVLGFHRRPDFPGLQHRSTQLVVEPDPEGRDDHWLVRSYVLTTRSRDGEFAVYWSGYCEDIVARSDGEWFFARRDIRPWSGAVLHRFAGSP